jgi:pimeloyl-ACP methyl ester carboxylesterase
MSTPQSSASQIEVRANGLTFTALAEGPTDGPLALCLHGFPDSAHTWRHLLPELAAAGFRAVAPWMRGYAPTEVPADGSYGPGALAADAVALHEALGADERAVLIGHDWGAIAAYGAANVAPERWARLVTIAIPPLGSLATKMFAYEQLKRSWYMYFLLTPMADMALPLDDIAFIDQLWQDWSPGYDAAADLGYAKDALRDPANLGAAVGYYRAMLGAVAPDPTYAAEAQAGSRIAPQPTLLVHGDQDGASAPSSYLDADAFLSSGSKEQTVIGTGHFPHLENPTQTNRLIVDWVTRWAGGA